MPAITALIHTNNDALRLGRALETLFPCDDIVVVDHGSSDATAHVAREYGARVVQARPGGSPSEYLSRDFSGWLLCLDARESLTEGLAASLFEWKTETVSAEAIAFSMYLREETAQGWVENPTAQTRLVPGNWKRWAGVLPEMEHSAVALEGQLLRFAFP